MLDNWTNKMIFREPEYENKWEVNKQVGSSGKLFKLLP
jgi:hypothetical protein